MVNLKSNRGQGCLTEGLGSRGVAVKDYNCTPDSGDVQLTFDCSTSNCALIINVKQSDGPVMAQICYQGDQRQGGQGRHFWAHSLYFLAARGLRETRRLNRPLNITSS